MGPKPSRKAAAKRQPTAVAANAAAAALAHEAAQHQQQDQPPAGPAPGIQSDSRRPTSKSAAVMFALETAAYNNALADHGHAIEHDAASTRYLAEFVAEDGFVNLSTDDIANRVLEVLGYAKFDDIPDLFCSHASKIDRARKSCAAFNLNFDATVYGLTGGVGASRPPQQHQPPHQPPLLPPVHQPQQHQQQPPYQPPLLPPAQHPHDGVTALAGIPPGAPAAGLTAADLHAIASVVHASAPPTQQHRKSAQRTDDQAFAYHISQQIRGTGPKQQNDIHIFKNTVDQQTELSACIYANTDYMRDLETALVETIIASINDSTLGLSAQYNSERVRAYMSNVFKPCLNKLNGDLQQITDSMADVSIFKRRWCVACMDAFADNNIDETKSKSITILMSMVNSAYTLTMNKFRTECKASSRAQQQRGSLVPGLAQPVYPYSALPPAFGVPQQTPPPYAAPAGPARGVPPSFPAMLPGIPPVFPTMPPPPGPMLGMYRPPPGPPPGPYPPPPGTAQNLHTVPYGEVFASGIFAGLRNAGRAPACHGCGWKLPAPSIPPHNASSCAINADRPGWSTTQQRSDWLVQAVPRQ
jgi:hypothetical protein